MKNSEIITAIDIGTSRVRALVGETSDSNDNIFIIGHSERNSDGGVVKGEITDMGKVSSALSEVLDEAESMASGIDLENVYIGITGSHISARDGSGTVNITSPDQKVTLTDMHEALKNAKGFSVPAENVTLNSIDGSFILDGTHPVSDPVGQTASKLEAFAHIILAHKNRVENFQAALKEMAVDNPKPVFSGMASAICVMTADDFEHGTLMINMGAGITEFMLFKDHIARETGVLPVGCDHIANDLFLGLDISISKARDIIENSLHVQRKQDGFNNVEIKGTLKNRNIPIPTIEKIIELRISEVFEVIRGKLKSRKLLNMMNNGVILCGGAANIPNVVEIAKQIFDTRVRIGKPIDISGPDTVLNSQGFVTTMGILRYAKHELSNDSYFTPNSLIKRIDYKLWSFGKKIWKTIINDSEK